MVERLPTLPGPEQGRAALALSERLDEMLNADKTAAADLEGLRRKIDIGIEQMRAGETVDGEEMMAALLRKRTP